MLKSRIALVLLAFILFLTSCSTTKQSDHTASVHLYLKQFEKNLALSDEVILNQFKIADKSNEVLLKTIRIMQNSETTTDSIRCVINFNNPTITFEDVSVRVDITTLIKSIDSTFALDKEIRFTLWLTAENDDFKITEWDVTEFYYEYHNAVYTLENHKNRAKDLASRQLYFDQASVLSKTYDSVIWYTRYQDSIYYYVVNGSWTNYFIGEDNIRVDSAKMGLVSETGRVVIPPAYNLVGTIGFTSPGVIEVKKKGLVGHYSITGVELVPVQYDWIIPYKEEGTYALVKQDSIFGWLDSSYNYNMGFPSQEAEQYIKEFKYLDNLNISKATKTMTEILDAKHMGYGLVIPPTHFVQARILSEIINEINLGDNALYYGGMEYFESRGSLFKTISDKVSALMVNLTESYVEGREGFYEHTNVTFFNDVNTPIATAQMRTGDLTFNKIDSTLLEVRVSRQEPADATYSEADDDMWYAPSFKYFRLADGAITELKSNRFFKFTEFVKMDSSYLKGTFLSWPEGENRPTISHFADESTIKRIRNEILASYGYVFGDMTITKNFEYRNWYKGKYSEYKDFEESMTEIDRYNLAFLENMVGTLRNNPPAF